MDDILKNIANHKEQLKTDVLECLESSIVEGVVFGNFNELIQKVFSWLGLDTEIRETTNFLYSDKNDVFWECYWHNTGVTLIDLDSEEIKIRSTIDLFNFVLKFDPSHKSLFQGKTLDYKSLLELVLGFLDTTE